MGEEIEKIKAQICFAGATSDLDKVREQLLQLKAEGKYEFYCCFLPRHIVNEKGFSTDIVDVLEESLGEELHWQLGEYENFSKAIAALPEVRKETAYMVNRMFVLDSKQAQGVANEIKLFTECKVIMM